MKNDFGLSTPEEIAQKLAVKIRTLRLAQNWKQTTLAKRSGVTLASLRRFEHTGKVSLQNLLKLSFALRRLDDFESLLQLPPAESIAELEASIHLRNPKRGSQ